MIRGGQDAIIEAVSIFGMWGVLLPRRLKSLKKSPPSLLLVLLLLLIFLQYPQDKKVWREGSITPDTKQSPRDDDDYDYNDYRCLLQDDVPILILPRMGKRRYWNDSLSPRRRGQRIWTRTRGIVCPRTPRSSRLGSC